MGLDEGFRKIVLQIINFIMGISLGYFTSVRTDFNEISMYILDSRILIIFLLVVIAVISKKEGIIAASYGVFGLAFSVSSELFSKISLFLQIGNAEFEFLIIGIINMMIMTAVFVFIGIVTQFSCQYEKLRKFAAIFPIAGAVFFTATTYYSSNINSMIATGIEAMIVLLMIILISFGWIKNPE